ncbi:MAG: methyltransferase domain-containing protein [bacterium]|nr:methyltransferase domain-containing protein [bacterium]
MNNRTSLSTSVRRYFIDNFFFSRKDLIKGKVIDIGGKKKNKRGLFDIGKITNNVTYINIERSTEPDIVSDAASIPLNDSTFDTAIIAELLEHVPEPAKVLMEAQRLLKPGGIALVTVPFNVGVHGDPSDYGRYTRVMLENMSREAGFSKVEIEEQGALFAVMALMIQHLFLAKKVSWRPIQIPIIKFLMWLDKRTTAPLLRTWTTGYGIVMEK